MKIFYNFIFYSIIFSDIDRNSIADKMKPIWSDAVIVLNHQFRLVEGLGKIKSYLCLFKALTILTTITMACLLILSMMESL